MTSEQRTLNPGVESGNDAEALEKILTPGAEREESHVSASGARGYEDIGCRFWLLSLSGKYDRVGVDLVRGHYSRRKPDSPQFMPPGETVVLIARDRLSVWGWWRPHPRSGIRAMNGLDGWTCSVFARHGGELASELILDAERALALLDAAGRTAGPCGPSGLITYVDRRKVPGPNPGYCFKVAGWQRTGISAKGKDLLQKPWPAIARAA